MDTLNKYIQGLKDNNARSKNFSAYKLGIMGDRRSLKPLIEALNDSNIPGRSNVAEALGNVGDVEALEPLYKYIEDDDFSVRYSVIEAIGNIAEANSERNGLYDKIIPKITVALGDNNYMIRHCSCEALSKIGGEHVKDLIKEILINGNDIEKEFAIWTIGKIGSIYYKEQLLDIFEETNNNSIKRAVITVFDQLGIDIKPLLSERGLNIDTIRETLFRDDIFNDELYYQI